MASTPTALRALQQTQLLPDTYTRKLSVQANRIQVERVPAQERFTSRRPTS